MFRSRARIYKRKGSCALLEDAWEYLVLSAYTNLRITASDLGVITPSASISPSSGVGSDVY